MPAWSILRAAVILVATAVPAGCAASDGSSATAAATSLPAPSVVPDTAPHSTPFDESTAMTTSAIDPGLQPYIDIAVDDLATRLSVAADAITVTSATLVAWPDSALGCPAPGQEYAKVATDGALIILELDGTEYRYHAGGSRAPFLCEKPGKSLGGTASTGL